MSCGFRSTYLTPACAECHNRLTLRRHRRCFEGGRHHPRSIQFSTLGPHTAMALRPLSRLGARLLSIVLLAGCARDAASPVEPTALPPKPNAALLGLLPVRGVTRAMPLANDISVSAVIDKRGGTLSIPEAGLTLVVPPNAVSEKTTF